MRYRSEIDGLRAIAVIPVILYHAGFSWFSGGFVGVDVFFVISGYLITNILLNEFEEEKFSLAAFYERRARRILPALFAMMLITAPFAYYYLLPDDSASFWRSITYICLFVSNYFFASESGYFSPDVELKPFLHTWSLAVEEQFYLIYPLLLAVLWRFGLKVVLYVILIIGVLSFIYADHGSFFDPINSFYSIISRGWELIIGALAALYFKGQFKLHQNGLISNVMGSLGLMMIILSMFFITNQTPFPGRYALIPTFGALLVIVFATSSNLPGKLLSLRPIVFIGVISYSLYLWHQPIIALARHKYVAEISPWSMLLVLFFVFVMSLVSWRLIERPFRDKNKFSRKYIYLFSILGGVGFIALSAFGTNSTYLNRFVSNAAYNDLDVRLRPNLGLSRKCEKTVLTSEECQTSSKPEILLWGDSYAMHIAGAIESSNLDVKMIQTTISQCGPVLGASSANAGYGAMDCIKANDKVFEMLKNTPSIKYVVLASPFERFGDDAPVVLRDGRLFNNGADIYLKLFKETISSIEKLGRIPVIIAPPPKDMNVDIGYCLRKSSLLGADLNNCNFNLDKMPQMQKKTFEAIRGLSKTTKVIWVSKMLCPSGECIASKGNILIYRDKGHLSYEGSSYLGSKYDFYKMITGEQ